MEIPNTAPYETLEVDAGLARVDRLLDRGRIATAVSVVLLLAWVVIAAIVVRDLWPPRDQATHESVSPE